MNKHINTIIFSLIMVLMLGLSQRITQCEKTISNLQNEEKIILLQVKDNENVNKKQTKQIDNIDLIMNKYSKQFGVDKNLIKAISIVESGGRHNVTSNSGAIGIMQLTPSTAKNMGVDPYNVDDNIKGATKYLAYLQKKYNGNQDLVIAGYNAGEGNVSKHKGVPSFSRKYVDTVKRHKQNLECMKK